MKKIMMALFAALVSTSIFALPTTTLQKEDWEYLQNSNTNGRVFLMYIDPENPRKLEISVAKYVKNEADQTLSDPMTVSCNPDPQGNRHNHATFKVNAGETVTCYSDGFTAWMQLMPADFKNGSKGYYEYQPAGK